MKNNLIIIIFLFIGYGCNKKVNYKLYTHTQKQEIAKKMIEKDSEAIMLYENLSKKLIESIDKGDKVALEELDTWETIIKNANFIVKPNKSLKHLKSNADRGFSE